MAPRDDSMERAESLAKKYEEKYKQAGDVASKLTIEEATRRKWSYTGQLSRWSNKDRVDRIQLDLDGLVKTLNERCKKYGLRGRPTTLTELSFGWQSGIQGDADWDEGWDKFEDEGFTFVKELSLDVSNVLAPPKQKSSSVQKEKAPPVESPTTASSLKVDVKSEKPQSTDAKVVENGAAYDKNEDESAKSAPNSPFASSTVGSPSREFSDSNYGKTTDADASPHNKESQSHDHAGAGSTLCFLVTKVPMNQHGGHLTIMMTLTQCGVSMQLVPPRSADIYLFIRTQLFDLVFMLTGYCSMIAVCGDDHLSLRVTRITTFLALGSSASTLSGLGDHKEVAFRRRAALLLSTILFLAHHSQPSIQDIHRQGTRIVQNLHLTPFLETLGRFDSMRSSIDFDQGHGFPTFDDIPDPFGSSVPFRSSLDSQTPRRDSDPFGSSGPFRTSLGSQTPRRESDFFGSSAAPFRTSFDGQTSRGDSDAFGSSPFRTSETRTHLGLQGLSGCHWRLREKTYHWRAF
ncbi:hypothetical protein DVH24_010129 [Malus domestica]|uniref:Uncharacterized protein n=1 Tax=Malus domestica TaxID=3750 RepID=A0A498JVG4_MALDO|nr:hypothetical protein DVH24_010129 [Malus domestica]